VNFSDGQKRFGGRGDIFAAPSGLRMTLSSANDRTTPKKTKKIFFSIPGSLFQLLWLLLSTDFEMRRFIATICLMTGIYFDGAIPHVGCVCKGFLIDI